MQAFTLPHAIGSDVFYSSAGYFVKEVIAQR